MTAPSQTTLKWLFQQLQERRNLNLVPLCSSCEHDAGKTKQEDTEQQTSTGTSSVTLMSTAPEKSSEKDLESDHNQPAEYMCRTCLTTLCSTCALTRHKTHRRIHLKFVFCDIFSTTNGLITSADQKLLEHDFDVKPPDNMLQVAARPNKASKDIKRAIRRTEKFKTNRTLDSSEPHRQLCERAYCANVDLKVNISREYYPLSETHSLNWPYGLSTSAKGSLYISNTYYHNILVINKNESTREFVGQRKNDIWMRKDKELFYPIGLSCSKDEKQVVVADSGNGAVKIFNCEGILIRTIKESLHRPHGVAFADSWLHDIMVTDIAQRSVMKYSLLDGRPVQTFSKPDQGSLESQMRQPSYIECGKNGKEIYVTDTLGKVIKVFDSRDNSLASTLGPFGSPHGLCVGPEEHTLVVADFGQSSINLVDLRKGKIVSHIAGINEGLIGPTDVAYHIPSRRVLVLDTTRGKVLQFPVLPQLPMAADIDHSTLTCQSEDWMETSTPRIVF